MDVGPKLERNANIAVLLFQVLTDRSLEYLGRFLVAVQLAEEDDLGVEGVDTGHVDGRSRAVANACLGRRSTSLEQEGETQNRLRYSFRHCAANQFAANLLMPNKLIHAICRRDPGIPPATGRIGKTLSRIEKNDGDSTLKHLVLSTIHATDRQMATLAD